MSEQSKKAVRQSIRTERLIRALQDHVDGNAELSATQVRAAEILLAKRLPNLKLRQAGKRESRPATTFVIKHD